MWPLTQAARRPVKGRVRKVSNSKTARRTRAPARKPLLREAPAPSWIRNVVFCVAAGIVLGVGGFAVVSSGAATQLAAAGGAAVQKALVAAGLKIARVTVTGRDRAGREDLLAALGAERGQPIMAFDCDAARARLIALPWIADATVRRVFPGDIQVDITERKPFAVWQNEGTLMLVDKTGFPIMPVSARDLTRYPHVVGAGAAENAAALMAALKAFPDIESRVRAAVRVGDRRWDLQLANGIAIELPEDGIEGALREVTRLDREMSVLSSDIKAIDMRFKDRWILKVPPGAQSLKPGPSRAT